MAESPAFALRTFLGGATLAHIPAGLNSGALSATADDLTTWVGAVAAGNTRAMLDRLGSNPEEVEISGVSGNDITFSERGLEGTDDATHDANVTIELISSPRDFREANKWTNELSGAATAANVAIAADGANSLTGIAVAASRVMARLAAGDYKACTVAEVVTLLQGTELAEYIFDTVAAMVTVNTETGIVVTSDDADNTLDFVVSSSLTTNEHVLSAPVDITTLNTFYDGPSVSLIAGTWLLVGAVDVMNDTAAAHYTAKLWNGTTVESVNAVLGSANGSHTIPLCGLVTPVSTTTWKISVASTVSKVGIQRIQSQPNYNSPGNQASHLHAVRVG